MKSADVMPFSLLDYLLSYFRDSPTTENMMGGGIRGVYCRFSSPRRLIYPVVHGLAEVVRPLSASFVPLSR